MPDLMTNTALLRVCKGVDRLPLELSPRGGLSFYQLIRREIEEGGDEDLARHHIVVEHAVYVYASTMDVDNDWVFRYEYERTPNPPRPHSHFHLNVPSDPTIAGMHFPAGRLSIEQIFVHLMHEHGVVALNGMPFQDAVEVLRPTHETFVRRRTDIESPPFP